MILEILNFKIIIITTLSLVVIAVHFENINLIRKVGIYKQK